MTALYDKKALDILEEGLSKMAEANELLIKQNKMLIDQTVELEAEIKQLKHKLLVNLETPERCIIMALTAVYPVALFA